MTSLNDRKGVGGDDGGSELVSRGQKILDGNISELAEV